MRVFIQTKPIIIILSVSAICSVFLNQLSLTVSSPKNRVRQNKEGTIIRNLANILSDESRQKEEPTITRSLVKILPDGNCTWVEPTDVNQDPDFDLFSTLLVSYPGSAKRAAHMQMAALTERTTRDDFYLDKNAPIQRYAFFKTQYPHHEGIWSWGSQCSQSIYVLQNPRRALITYFFILEEIYFSTTWQKSYDALDRVFTINAPVDSWKIWRNNRFRSEIHQWSWHLDFWMEDGLMRDFFTHNFTTPEHFVRLMSPERFSEGELRSYQAKLTDVQPSYDPHCANGLIQSRCSPVAVTSYEGIIDHTTGPQETDKLANAIGNKAGIPVIDQRGRECAWRKVVIERVTGIREDRDRVGPPFESYIFTREEMQTIVDELERVRDKYSSVEWASNKNAQQIVGYMEDYIVENQAILDAM